jgi:hypothetical protein
MFAEQIRRAVEASPRVGLPKLSAALWKAYAAGGVSEEEAEALSELIEARKKIAPMAAPRLVQRRLGSRPRTPASMARRRSWAAAGRLPPHLAAQFTTAEVAVLAVVAVEVERGGACVLTLEHLAALAGVCRSTVKNALREAQRVGIVSIEERRVSAWRNLPNKVTIVSPEWLTWMRLRSKRGGGKSVPPTSSQDFRRKEARSESGLGRLPRASSAPSPLPIPASNPNDGAKGHSRPNSACPEPRRDSALELALKQLGELVLSDAAKRRER